MMSTKGRPSEMHMLITRKLFLYRSQALALMLYTRETRKPTPVRLDAVNVTHAMTLDSMQNPSLKLCLSGSLEPSTTIGSTTMNGTKRSEVDNHSHQIKPSITLTRAKPMPATSCSIVSTSTIEAGMYWEGLPCRPRQHPEHLSCYWTSARDLKRLLSAEEMSPY